MPSPSKVCLVSWQPVRIYPTLFHQPQEGGGEKDGERESGRGEDRMILGGRSAVHVTENKINRNEMELI